MAKAQSGRSRKIILPPALGSYCNLLVPRPIKGDDGEPGKPKYSVALLWPKTEEKKLEAVKRLIVEAAVEKFGAKAPEMFKSGKLKHPLHDGDVDKSDEPTYAGMIFSNAKSDSAPQIIDTTGKPICEAAHCYSGCTFVASVNVFAYDVKGGRGVSLWLNNVLVQKEGPRLDGKLDAVEDFKEYIEPSGESITKKEEDEIT